MDDNRIVVKQYQKELRNKQEFIDSILEKCKELQDRIRRRNLQIKELKKQVSNIEVAIDNGIDYLKTINNTDSQSVIRLLQNR